MIPGHAKLVECPYCGAKKELMTIVSGNTIDAVYWSDNKKEAPMLPRVSPVQKCPECGKYYIERLQKYTYGDDYSGEEGWLTYEELVEAYRQFSKPRAILPNDYALLMQCLIQAYNDRFRNNFIVVIDPQKDEAFVAGIILKFIKIFDWEQGSPLFKAELYREAGEMEKCSEVLQAINPSDLDDFNRTIFFKIKERMERGDRKVFRIN